MATDGIKIIDGDTAHDTYWGIMDLYDSGADLQIIEKEFPLEPANYSDDFENEVYATSCALALWEIGQLTEEKLCIVKAIIEKGACVRAWSAENEKDGPARQKELAKFLKKIGEINIKVRARKKHRKITNLYFQPDDLLTFKLNDGNYRAAICTSISQYRGECEYILVPTTYNSNKKPTVDDLKDKEIVGTLINSTFNRQTLADRQPGIERIWKFVGGDNKFSFGVVQINVDHKDIVKLKDEIKKVGSLKIVEGLKQTGSYRYEENLEGLARLFGDIDDFVKKFNCQTFPVKVLCDIEVTPETTSKPGWLATLNRFIKKN